MTHRLAEARADCIVSSAMKNNIVIKTIDM